MTSNNIGQRRNENIVKFILNVYCLITGAGAQINKIEMKGAMRCVRINKRHGIIPCLLFKVILKVLRALQLCLYGHADYF